MYTIQKRSGQTYAIKDLVFNYPNYLNKSEIIDIFENIRDCSGLLFDMYDDSDDATIDEKVLWMRKYNYIELVELKEHLLGAM